MMPSARIGPDQKHALEALWRKWVFLSSGIDRLVASVLFALSKLFGAERLISMRRPPASALGSSRRSS